MGAGTNGDRRDASGGGTERTGPAAGDQPETGAPAGAADANGTPDPAGSTAPAESKGAAGSTGAAGKPGATGSAGPSDDDASPGEPGTGTAADSDAPTGTADADTATDTADTGSTRPGSRRPPKLTTDTARPEGGGRAAPGDAPAPARQWPLLTVLSLVGLGLLIVGLDPFPQAFRVGTLIVGVALLVGGVLRRVLPSVGMLAVRSRFTDMVTYGLLGVAITLLALTVQPQPWLELPFLEDLVRFTVRSDGTV
ncbi:DUF3017 domain-containing protein [Streptomyces sp. NPDC057638]|uniref:DUF3017 domain-containing protein n=1 Tax=Streptomyces sp. NPDC057638 TaxID=3346190 RepID=UPI00369A74CB